MIQDYQAIYNKHKLLMKYSTNDVERLGISLMNSRISLNPHQINAALFFFKRNYQDGVMFADEVGLGKTIEAGLVISQLWAEHKRNILIVAPASLLKQWNEELYSKFFLESIIVDGALIKSGYMLENNQIYIASYHTVYQNKSLFERNFSLVLFDEAHRLRNVYKTDNLMSNTIKDLFKEKKKIFLTATPFQNNLLELYGLLSILDEKLLGGIELFRNKYINNFDINRQELTEIMGKVVNRTLRKDVEKYINFTKRIVVESYYDLTSKEISAYEAVTNLIYSNTFDAFYEGGQRQLLVILLQKLMSSSIFAVTNTLKNMFNNKTICTEDVYSIEKLDNTILNELNIAEFENCIRLLESIEIDSKANHLLNVLKEQKKSKILIFTEYKSTQEYLVNLLKNQTDYKVLKFNGENNDSISREIYNSWIQSNPNTSKNKNANMRRALVEAFEKDYDILVATDAAAEGLNLQFCSLVINYDLPWNPQKIEQRIGRCHRFGQKQDVVVINILNKDNFIDLRIYDLLKSKCTVFESTFGSSDNVLSNDELDLNLEKSISDILKKCRKKEEIIREFEILQEKFKYEIKNEIEETKMKLISNFDKEVQEKFDINYEKAMTLINDLDKSFLKILKYTFKDNLIMSGLLDFYIQDDLFKGYYTLDKSSKKLPLCTINDKLGTYSLESVPLYDSENKYILNYNKSNEYIGFLEENKCRSGYIVVSHIISNSFNERTLLSLNGIFDDETLIPEDICSKIIELNSSFKDNIHFDIPQKLKLEHEKNIKIKLMEIDEDNRGRFKEESDYINNYLDNKIEEIQFNVELMREERKNLQKLYDTLSDVQQKIEVQNKIIRLSKKIKDLWIKLADQEQLIESKREELNEMLLNEKNKEVKVNNIIKVRFEIYE